MGSDDRYGVRELKSKEHDQLARLVGDGDRWETLFIEAAAADPEAAPGWWLGALRSGETLEAVVYVHEHVAHLYSADRAATRAIARSLLKTQAVLGSMGGTHRHQVIGEARTVDDFWTIFKHLEGRSLISDRFRQLMVSDELPDKAPSRRIKLGYAGPRDARVVYEFTAERALEALGYDPRRTQPRAHGARCQQVIAEQRQLLGKDGGKPVFVAELQAVDDGHLMLENVFVPRPFRGRKRLIGGALYLARKAPQARGKDLLFFADSDAFEAAAELAGFVRRCTYRHIVTYG